jgi:glyoxylase-like metal-dependent hydrolase (beta-lactamase superfamily II)
MIKIDTLPLGSYQTNCYIVWNDAGTSCAVIDPGFEPDIVLHRLSKLGLTLDAILLTHGHFDHVGAVESLVEATACRVWIRESDYTQVKNPMNDYLYPLHDRDFCEFSFCEEGETIQAGGLQFSVIETPGHTWGSVCYLCEDAMFCGDTLFAGSCGRIDLPGSNRTAMMTTLTRLSEIEEDYRIFPGHGDSSTLRREQQANPYLKGYL